ncbi:MAG: hypothetical protein EB127_08850, partial [Alphaproteobacteria bacterium]|nr:hypothetical protein [Alphaproteobacteria bacterium]
AILASLVNIYQSNQNDISTQKWTVSSSDVAGASHFVNTSAYPNGTYLAIYTTALHGTHIGVFVKASSTLVAVLTPTIPGFNSNQVSSISVNSNIIAFVAHPSLNDSGSWFVLRVS